MRPRSITSVSYTHLDVYKRQDIGGAYVGKDGYDFEKITPEDVDEKQIARNVKAVSYTHLVVR